MDLILDALREELWLELPDMKQIVRVAVRLLLAVLLTAIIGWEREVGNKTAGLRTHMLVSLGAALFTVTALEATQNNGDVMRVIQGVATGVGFIGGGAILKLESRNRVRGLTTAGTIWLAAAIGVAAGLGKIGAAAIGILLAWFILVVLERMKGKPQHSHHSKEENDVLVSEG
ncbi:MgtC/SapB family protein [bacterium]|nr:MAG: MgtC/SapB family protein [bacterium]